jgi:uncharacterized membrane protein
MAETFPDLVRMGKQALLIVEGAIEARNMPAALTAAKALLSVGSKLHARITALDELLAEGFAAAEVDRALSRARASEVPAVKGEQPLPLTPPSSTKAKAARRRKV